MHRINFAKSRSTILCEILDFCTSRPDEASGYSAAEHEAQRRKLWLRITMQETEDVPLCQHSAPRPNWGHCIRPLMGRRRLNLARSPESMAVLDRSILSVLPMVHPRICGRMIDFRFDQLYVVKVELGGSSAL